MAARSSPTSSTSSSLTGSPSSAQSSTPSTAGPTVDIVVVRCDAAGRNPSVTAFQGSTRAPTARAPECAETLSLLMSDGFALRDVGHYDEPKAGFALYTLAR